jgi:hypothetical protein
MGYEIRNNIDKGYFSLIKSNRSIESFEYLLDKHKIHLNDYWIVKSTRNFKLLEKDEYKKYSGIMCFRKDLYKKEDIEMGINFLIKIDLTIPYISIPFPPVEVLNKIKIIK